MKTFSCKSFAILAILLSMSTAVLAQYVWVDEKGNKQFSDQPPPASVAKNKILKYAGRSFDAPSSVDDADSTGSSEPKHELTMAEKDLASKKRRDELAAKAKKDAEAANIQAAKADNCKRLKEYKMSLDSGQRIAQFNTAGEKAYLTDEQRSQEQATTNQRMADCN